MTFASDAQRKWYFANFGGSDSINLDVSAAIESYREKLDNAVIIAKENWNAVQHNEKLFQTDPNEYWRAYHDAELDMFSAREKQTEFEEEEKRWGGVTFYAASQEEIDRFESYDQQRDYAKELDSIAPSFYDESREG